MRILVADDDKLFQMVMVEILGNAGHEVILASTGEEALEKSTTERPELIILDVILPGLLGTEVCQKLRGYSRTAPVPILLISSCVTGPPPSAAGPGSSWRTISCRSLSFPRSCWSESTS